MSDSTALTADNPLLPNPSTGAPSRSVGVGLLLIVTLIWGTTFVATKSLVGGASPALSPGAVTFWRFAIAAACVAPLALGRLPRHIWLVGLELSFWLWAGYATQAIGLQYTTVSKSAFVTSMNVVFVPILTVLAGRRVGWLVWSMTFVAFVGAGLLSYDGSDPNIGDLWTLGCAVTYAVYIVRLERYAGRFDAIPLTAVQLAGVAAFSLPWMAFEAATTSPGWGRWTPGVVAAIVYMGIVATLVTTWLQAIGQKSVPGTHASLLYTTEPLFASAIAMTFFGDRLGSKGWLGAGIILVAAIVSQATPMWRDRRRLVPSAGTSGGGLGG